MINSASFYKTLKKHFPFEPTLKQDIFFQKVAEFVLQNNNDQIFILKGYAGTGKTSIISTLVNQLVNVEKKYILLAPTGRAAKVIANYSQKPAFTIHKRIYFPKKNKSGAVSFTMQQNKFKNTVFIVDESSMISDVITSYSIHYTKLYDISTIRNNAVKNRKSIAHGTICFLSYNV